MKEKQDLLIQQIKIMDAAGIIWTRGFKVKDQPLISH